MYAHQLNRTLLTQIRQAHGTCRFLYLMGRKSDGSVFFFLDSQPLDSEDYAPPGLIYEEIMKLFKPFY
jgi:hypothetical protein